jgi:hypothetical protein
MDKKKLALAAELLEEASNEFSNHGCNDFQLENTDENWQLICDMEDWNRTSAEDRSPRPPLNRPIYTMDWYVMSYLAAFLKAKSNE